MIAIVSYGLGNVRAFFNIYERFGIPARIAHSAEDLRGASHLIMPGVGSFDWAMQKLSASGLRAALEELALNDKRPVLGVCVGMQMMVERSEEGNEKGLGWLRGKCRRLESHANGRPLALPHMGWNEIALPPSEPLFAGMEGKGRFYFLHSYHVVSDEASSAIAYAHYGQPFVCAMRRDNLVAVQFHPEKSHHWGERLLLNFASS